MVPVNMDSAEFRELLVAGDVEAWAKLCRELRGKFHCPDCDGKSAEDFLQEALVRFEVCLASGKVDPERPLTPFILTIARHQWLDSYRRWKRRGGIAGDKAEEMAAAQGIPADGVLHETPFTSLEKKEQEQGLVEGGDAKSKARDLLVHIIESFRKQGPSDSFRFLQAVILKGDELNRAWEGSTSGTSLRTTQRHRQEILKKAMSFAVSEGTLQ